MNNMEQTKDVQVTPTASGVRLTALLAGETYRVDMVDPQARVLDSALVAPERRVRPSGQGHIVDGVFTCMGDGREWADIEPVKGRYSYLYADFDGTHLHILNDWHLCREPVSEWDFNKFEARTWPQGAQEQVIRWRICVYAHGEVRVEMNGAKSEGFVEGKYGHSTSVLIPHKEHSIYELSVAVAEAHRRQDRSTSAGDWQWEMEWLDPPAASPNAELAATTTSYFAPLGSPGLSLERRLRDRPVGQVKEPVWVEGILLRDGGLTIAANWNPPKTTRQGGQGRMSVRCNGDVAEVETARNTRASAGQEFRVTRLSKPGVRSKPVARLGSPSRANEEEPHVEEHHVSRVSRRSAV